MKEEKPGGGGSTKPDTYFFFVGNDRYETDQPSLTGAQIKAKVPSWVAGYGLLVQGQGNDPDTLVGDNDVVSLEKDKGPKRFTSVPPATYGQG